MQRQTITDCCHATRVVSEVCCCLCGECEPELTICNPTFNECSEVVRCRNCEDEMLKSHGESGYCAPCWRKIEKEMY